MELKPVKTKRTSETILEQIKDLLISGQIGPGDKLLTERELAERMRVSRASVREALAALSLSGVIEVRHGEGIYIKRPEENAIIEPLAFLMLLEKDDVQHILEVRKALEVEAAGLAAERAQEEDLSRIKAAIARMEEDLQVGNSGEESDLLFHFAIAEASHNPLLIRLMNTVHETMRQTLKITRQLWLSATQGTAHRLFEEHCQIYEAITNRDKELARTLMYQHLVKVEIELARFNLIRQQRNQEQRRTID